MSDLDYQVGLEGTAFARGARNIKGESKKLGSAVQSEFKSMSTSSLGFAGVFGRGGPIVAGMAVVVGAVKMVSDSVNQLSAQAKTAGTDFEAFQELKYYFDQNLVGVDALTDGLKEMQLRLDEAATTGGGPAVDALGRLGYTAEEISKKLKDPPKLLEEIIDRTKQLDKAAQIRVLDEIFGGTAQEQFQRIMGDAVGSISRAREEARKLGLVLDDDYLKTVEDVNRQWQFMETYVGTNLKRAILDSIVAAGQLLDKFRDIENRMDSSLDNNLADIGRQRIDIENQISSLREKQRNNTYGLVQINDFLLGNQIKSLEVEQKKLATTEAQIMAEQKRRNAPAPASSIVLKPTTDGFNTNAPGVARLTKELEEQRGALARTNLENEIYNRLKSEGIALNSDAGQKLAAEITEIYNETEAKKAANDAARKSLADSTSERKKSIAEMQRQAEAVKDLLTDLQFENEQLGRNALQQEIYSKLKSVDVGISSRMGQTIASEVTALYQKEQALEAVKKQQEANAVASEYLFDTAEQAILSIVDGSDDAADALKKLGLQLVFTLAKAALLGQGPLAGLFGGGGLSFGGGGGGFSSAIMGSVNTGLFHSGTGSVGSGSSQSRQVPAHVFATAPRFHKGTFGVDEVPAVLKKGEIVDPGDGSIFAKKFGGKNITYAPVISFTGTSSEMAELKKIMADDKANFTKNVAQALEEGGTRGYI